MIISVSMPPLFFVYTIFVMPGFTGCHGNFFFSWFCLHWFHHLVLCWWKLVSVEQQWGSCVTVHVFCSHLSCFCFYLVTAKIPSDLLFFYSFVTFEESSGRKLSRSHRGKRRKGVENNEMEKNACQIVSLV